MKRNGPVGSRPAALIRFLILSFTAVSSLNMLQIPESHLWVCVGVRVWLSPPGKLCYGYMLIKCTAEGGGACKNTAVESARLVGDTHLLCLSFLANVTARLGG